MDKICAFFGHRELWRDIHAELEDAVKYALDNGCRTFWCGGYGAFDLCAAGTVHRLKTEVPNLQLVGVLAYLPQHRHPSELYDFTIYPEGLETIPQRFAISKRNQWMVQNCDWIIACVDHRYGGAYTAYRQALKEHKVLVNLGTL